MHKYSQNQNYVGSSGQTLTTNVSITKEESAAKMIHDVLGFSAFSLPVRSLNSNGDTLR